MTIGIRIKELRKKAGLTQKELGTLSDTSETTIKQYELGKRQPRVEQLSKIADALNVTPAYIMGWDNTRAEGYYLSEKTAKLAQEMYEDEDMRSLFDMKRNMPPERFKAHMEFMKNLYQQEKGDKDID